MQTDNFYVKRVIGLPGDVIEMKNDQLYVNHQVKNEEYLKNNKKQAEKLLNQFNLKILDRLQFLKIKFL